MKRTFLNTAVVLGLFLSGLVLAGCGESRSQFAGTYRSEEAFVGNKHVDLELKDNGKGTWTLAGKSVEFTWVVHEGKVWLYLKSGGIIIGTPSEGGTKLALDMSADWHPGCPANLCVSFKRSAEGG